MRGAYMMWEHAAYLAKNARAEVVRREAQAIASHLEVEALDDLKGEIARRREDEREEMSRRPS